MNNPTKRNLTKVRQIITAWETTAPEATFAGMTLEQFREMVQPAFDLQQKAAALGTEFVNTRKQLVDASWEGVSASQRVAFAVKSDKTFGEDCPLYSAMGYVRKSDRKSGLVRKTAAMADKDFQI